MLRVSRLADYAVLIVSLMVNREEKKYTAPELSKNSGLNLATVNKILSLLVKSSIIVSYRGVNGGYKIAKKPEMISMKDLVEAIDGPVSLTLCIDKTSTINCSLFEGCISRLNWQKVNNTISASLSQIKLSEMKSQDYFKHNELNPKDNV